MARELFTDVMLDHPWVSKYRIPVIRDFYPSYHYLVTLAALDPNAPEDRQNLWGIEEPTEEEAAMVGSYIQFKVADQHFREWYLKEVQARILDLDGGFNTLSLAKRNRGLGWGYRRMTYQNGGLWPYYDAEIKYHNLVDLLDKIESWSDNELRKSWVAWKQEHPEIFGKTA